MTFYGYGLFIKVIKYNLIDMNRILPLALMALITTLSSGQTNTGSEDAADVNSIQWIAFDSHPPKTLLKAQKSTKRLIDYVLYDTGIPIDKIWKRQYFRTDATDRKGTYCEYDWDDEQQDYKPVPKSMVKYNNSDFDKPTIRVDYYLDEGQNKFVPRYKYSHTYNNQQQLSKYEEFEYKTAEAKWMSVLAEEYTYYADGKKHTEIKYRWNNDTKQKDGQSHREFKYDESGHFSGAICKRWNTDTRNWYLSHKFVYTNNAKGHPVKEMIYKRNADSNNWEIMFNNTFKQEYEYDSNGNQTLRKQSKKNDDGSWFVYRKDEASFDNQGRKTMKALYLYMDYSNSLEGMEKLEFEYNDKGGIKVETSYHWHDKKKQWTVPHRYTYFYKDTPTQTTLLQSQDNIVFPNPVNDVLNIVLKDTDSVVSLKIYSIQGELILDNVHLTSQKVNLSHLNPGIYIYRLQANGKFYQGKIQKL